MLSGLREFPGISATATASAQKRLREPQCEQVQRRHLIDTVNPKRRRPSHGCLQASPACIDSIMHANCRFRMPIIWFCVLILYAKAAQRPGFRADWDGSLRHTELEGLTQTERLAEAIAESVLSGEFQPGLRLDESMLAERFGVSRTPVREALRQLTSTGLIDVKPRRGATVVNATSAQLETLFAAMAEIEAACARLAAMSMTPIERRRLEGMQEAMGTFVARNDRDAYSAANIAFHTHIYLGAHNDILSEFANGLRRRLAPFRRAQFRTDGRISRSHAEHGAVVKAILACDVAGAHAAMFHHMSLVEDSFGRLGTTSAAGALSSRAPKSRSESRARR
jgi:DNA-binding GntR family transcriptional regulator